MIGRFSIDTSVYHKDANRYYSMLDPKVNSIITVHLDHKVVHLKCTMSWGGTCEGCYFKEKGICPENGHNCIGLACAPLDRFDGNHCVYVEVPTRKKNKEQPAEVKDYSGYTLKRNANNGPNTQQLIDEAIKQKISDSVIDKLETSKLIPDRHFGLIGYRKNEDTLIKDNYRINKDTLIKDDYLWQII